MRSEDLPGFDPAALLARLPPAPPPQGGYVPAVVEAGRDASAGLVVTAGMTPRVDGVIQHPGRVGIEVSVDDARRAAAIAAGNALAAAAAALTGSQRLVRVLRMTVWVSAAPDFEQHTAVADGASALLREILGAHGDAARAAVGVTSLPGGACVELALTCTWAAPRAPAS